MSSTIHLRQGGVSLVIARDTLDAGSAPVVVHWGADLGDASRADLDALAALHRPGVPHSAFDHPRSTGLLPETTRGYTGTRG